MTNTNIYFLFLFAIFLHNLEEALWLPQWSKYARKFHKEVKAYEFHFAVIIITALAVLVTAMFMIFPNNFIAKCSYFGLLVLMIFNAFFPHLLLTVVLKRYAPGTITGLLLNVPINSLIIYKAINNGVISFITVLISASVVSGLALISLPLLFKLGNLVKDYNAKLNIAKL